MERIYAKDKQLYCGEAPILLRGFGLGGWLLPEGYMWKFYTKCDRPRRMEKMIAGLCGQEYADAFWLRYYDRYITESDIALIAGQGFNSVRLPINARHYREHQRYIDALIGWCRAYGVYVILDMHAAPGGQTGQNIDDSEADIPELFTTEKYRTELAALWRDIAARYRDEPAIAGYDLLNEPLPNWWNRYNARLMPLYDDLIVSIREIDTNHMIILEGAHWASDFSVFADWEPPAGETNLLLQFHKYWNNPDIASLEAFLAQQDRLNLPLFMGEGGENNIEWYAGAFPLYERLGISWSFWSYKKMDNTNSPISFPVPEGWQRLLAYLDGGEKPAAEKAAGIFDRFLDAIADTTVNTQVFKALKREAPLSIPCEFYDDFSAVRPHPRGAELNIRDSVNIAFADGHTGLPDYKRYNGEPQPKSENLIVMLEQDEWLEYRFRVPESGSYTMAVTVRPTEGVLEIRCGDMSRAFALSTKGVLSCDVRLTEGLHTLRLCCKKGEAAPDTVAIH